MQTFELTHETGWHTIPGDTTTIVVHFYDGHKETVGLVDFLIMRKDKVSKIDCYKAGEKIES